MKIKRTVKDKVKFTDVELGQVFYYSPNDSVCIRVSNSDGKLLGANLVTGQVYQFYIDDLVELLPNATLLTGGE